MQKIRVTHPKNWAYAMVHRDNGELAFIYPGNGVKTLMLKELLELGLNPDKKVEWTGNQRCGERTIGGYKKIHFEGVSDLMFIQLLEKIKAEGRTVDMFENLKTVNLRAGAL